MATLGLIDRLVQYQCSLPPAGIVYSSVVDEPSSSLSYALMIPFTTLTPQAYVDYYP